MKKLFQFLIVSFTLMIMAGCGSSGGDSVTGSGEGQVAENLYQIVNARNVTLQWDGNVGEDWVAFNVYDMTTIIGDGVVPIATVSENSFTVHNLPANDTYLYQVTTVHRDGHESNPTNMVEVYIPAEGTDPTDG